MPLGVKIFNDPVFKFGVKNVPVESPVFVTKPFVQDTAVDPLTVNDPFFPLPATDVMFPLNAPVNIPVDVIKPFCHSIV